MSKKDLVNKKRSVGKTSVDTVKEEITKDAIEVSEPNREDTPIPQIQGDPALKFAKEMREGELPPEAKGRNQYIFHRETGRKLISFKEIYENRKNAFEVWAKTEEYALEQFMKRTQWKKRKGNTPCPVPKED